MLLLTLSRLFCLHLSPLPSLAQRLPPPLWGRAGVGGRTSSDAPTPITWLCRSATAVSLNPRSLGGFRCFPSRGKEFLCDRIPTSEFCLLSTFNTQLSRAAPALGCALRLNSQLIPVFIPNS